MSFSRPIQWYHSQADPIWPDGTFKGKIIFCGAVSVDEYLQSPSPVPVEVDNLVFQGKLKGDTTA
jgi:hypothetical protein